MGARRRQEENPSFPHHQLAQDPTTALTRQHRDRDTAPGAPKRCWLSPAIIPAHLPGVTDEGFWGRGDCSNFPLLSAHIILQANPFQPYGALISQTCPLGSTRCHPSAPRIPLGAALWTSRAVHGWEKSTSPSLAPRRCSQLLHTHRFS